jgi:hypothetical protein
MKGFWRWTIVGAELLGSRARMQHSHAALQGSNTMPQLLILSHSRLATFVYTFKTALVVLFMNEYVPRRIALMIDRSKSLSLVRSCIRFLRRLIPSLHIANGRCFVL